MLPFCTLPGTTLVVVDQRHPLWQDDLLRGIAAEAQKDNVEATAAYSRVLALNPSAVEAQKRLNALTRKIAPTTSSTP